MTVTDAIARNRAALTMIKEDPFNAEAPHDGLRTDTTPTQLHYVRSNFALPHHDGTLQVAGAVATPHTLTLGDLRALPAAEHVVTLECAGNGRLDMRPLPTGEPWGGYAVSTARWKGARLADVLARADPAGDGVEVRCQGADHGKYHLSSLFEKDDADITFVRSLALAHASDPAAEILIAYEMNGEPLEADHGAPFRLIVPHWYAVASVKWLSRLDVITKPFAGEFQTGHYVYQWPDKPVEPVTLMRVRARITDPADACCIPAGRYTIRGKAWSGSGAITQVGLSFTGASEWNPAVVEPPNGPFQWQDWSYEWDATPGRHSLRARATDASGNIQPEVPPWNRLGYGNNAVEVAYVEVR
ncbi:sulfite oxidase [Actinoplanes sp. NPDC051411]|uniref:sulfite oxidase n=1 Tax=Actinoplanes sp. NPDC051411 TaxID=3155522 RepID=UPI003446E852